MPRRCEAENHVPGCDGMGSTKDHITPKSIRNTWEMPQDDPDNIQYLSPACHEAKDETTPQRSIIAKIQKKGKLIRFGEHEELISIKPHELLEALEGIT